VSSHGEWVAFWNSQHSIYVNARHRDVHYQTIARDLRARIPAGARLLDFGCGEALHADLVAETTDTLTLCEAAPLVRAALARRFAGHPRIQIRSAEEISALPPGSFDTVVMHSVAQYLTPGELDRLLAVFHKVLSPGGQLIIGDVIPTHVGAATDALSLLRLASANGFLGAALVGLLRTLASRYWRLRSRLGLTRYAESAFADKLRAAGFSASRASANIGHNPARMTWVARPLGEAPPSGTSGTGA
jgi:SAM-dependent methyltransferase